MSKGFAFVLVLVFLTASCIMVVKPVSGASAVDNSWVERAPMPTGEYFLGAVSVNGEIYAIGSGFTYVYNPATDVWVSKTPMPTNQQHFAIAACQGKIYVIGGWNSTDPNTGYPILTGANEMYDPATGTWEAKAPLPTPTDYVQANVVNGEIYVMGGSTWVYDPSNDSWSTAAPIPTPVYGYASAVVNNKIYIEGGQSGNNGQLSNLNQIYDPETNVWTIGSPLPTAVNYAAAGVTTGVLAPTRLYVMGGVTRATDGVRGVDTVQIYDPQADSWVNGSSMPTSRLGLAVAVVNDTLFAIGGVLVWGFGFVDTVYAVNEQYLPLGYQGPVPSPFSPPASTSSPSPSPSPSPTPTTTPPNTAIGSFPTATVAAVSVASAMVVVAGLLVYFKKYKR